MKNYSIDEPKLISTPKVEHIIFIVGESESAKHVSAFDYERKTTPFFEQMKGRDDVLLKPVYSAAVMTRVALPTLFNSVAYPNGLEHIIKGKTNLFYLARKQGFETHWYSAQASNEMNIMNLIGGKWLDHISFPESFGFSSKESMPDFKLMDKFKSVDFDKRNQFLVLHQRGSHSPYGSLLTREESARFGNDVLDKYDATIYNTDLFINEVYNNIKEKNLKNWILIYTSDHGAYVKKGMFNQGTRKDDNYIVPLFITSDNKVTMRNIKNIFKNCKIGYHQQLATLLTQIMGYDMPVSGCEKGVVNTQLLTGDAGYICIEGREVKFVTP